MHLIRFLLIFLSLFLNLNSIPAEKIEFVFSDELIDVVIPCVEKDLPILELCIEAIKKYGENIRRIIVISKHHLTDSAEWFPEENFPFSINDVKVALINGVAKRGKSLIKAGRVGWYYQQLLKFYAAYTIPDISTNILILDSDTIFLKPVTFLNDEGAALYNYGLEHVKGYFLHAHNFVPNFKRCFNYSGITHHMMFQKPVLDTLFNEIETYHQKPLWQAFCKCVDTDNIYFAGASEYEIYFNYAFSCSDQFSLRKLRNRNLRRFKNLDYCRRHNYDYVSIHAYSRKDD